MDFAHKISYFFFVTLFFNGGSSTIFTIVNHCSYPVFPGLLFNAGTSPLPITGFSLNSFESRLISLPAAWSGRIRIWARTHCHQNSTTRKFSCLTGDCSSQLECSGRGPNHPTTVAEFTLNSKGNLDSYNVSLVKGFNVPITIIPSRGGVGNCKAAGCEADLNVMCPEELKLKVTVEEAGEMTVACRNACEEFGTWDNCCSIEFGTSDTCHPSKYSVFFKEACPMGYSYAYVDDTSTFTCSDSDYTITFCPKPSLKKTVSTSLQREAVSVSAASPTLSVVFSLGVLAVAVYLLGEWTCVIH